MTGSCSLQFLHQVAKNEITTADAGEPLGGLSSLARDNMSLFNP